MKRLLPVLVVLASLLTTPIIAQDFDKGVAAEKRGDYAAALREWRPLAEQGDARAQYNLGQLYLQGLGVPQEPYEAAKWHRLAAEQGNAVAQFSLGLVHWLGQGLPQDYVRAHMWFNIAAVHGYMYANKGRDRVAKLMAAGDISKAERMAREWLAAHPQM